MVGDKGDTSKKQQPQQVSSSPKALQHEESSSKQVVVVSGTITNPFISSPLFVSSGASSSPFENQFETTSTTTTKRPRYSGQWKLLPSPQQQKQPQTQTQITNILNQTTESKSTTPSPSNLPQQQQPQTTLAASSSETTSSQSHDHLSPMPCQEGNKHEEQVHQQLRKGKYVSPVWKPNEMLWLARAWKEQFQTGSDSSSRTEQQQADLGMSRGKTRADKDKEVAEFLNKHGVSRDAKTAGKKNYIYKLV
jgi:hypothetical protein